MWINDNSIGSRLRDFNQGDAPLGLILDELQRLRDRFIKAVALKRGLTVAEVRESADMFDSERPARIAEIDALADDCEDDREVDPADWYDLDALYDAIKAGDAPLTTDLPVFADWNNPEGVWSWDETHMIVGTCADDVELVARSA